MNKRGISGNVGWMIALIAIVLITIYVIIATPQTTEVFKNRMGEPSVSFGDAWDNDAFRFLDYIFGKIPSHLIEWREDASGLEIGASIITIAIWVLFLLTFGDIMTTFGFFSKQVGWMVAVVLAIIAANIQILKFVSVVGLSVTAIFGTASVLLSLLWIFVLFVLFHFGSGGLRRWVMIRRAEDSAMRAVAGGKKAAAGIDVLKDIVARAERGE